MGEMEARDPAGCSLVMPTPNYTRDCPHCGTFAWRCQAEDRRGVLRCAYTGKAAR
jgi:hypothetical protein